MITDASELIMMLKKKGLIMEQSKEDIDINAYIMDSDSTSHTIT